MNKRVYNKQKITFLGQIIQHFILIVTYFLLPTVNAFGCT